MAERLAYDGGAVVWGQVVRVALLALQNLLAAPGLELAPEMVEAGLLKVVQQRLVQVRTFPGGSCLEHPDGHCQHAKLVHQNKCKSIAAVRWMGVCCGFWGVEIVMASWE